MSFHKFYIARSGHRPPIIPAPLSIVPIIRRCEPISRQELGELIDLDGRLLDQLLAALVSIGQIVASREGGQTVYRATATTI